MKYTLEGDEEEEGEETSGEDEDIEGDDF